MGKARRADPMEQRNAMTRRTRAEMNLLPPDPDSYGPAMRALNDRQQRFVQALIQYPTATPGRLAELAGYGSETSSEANMRQIGWRLFHHEGVLAAVHEETAKTLRRGGIVGISGLLEIATDQKHPDRFKACLALADRAGFPAKTEHKVVVEHKDDDARMLMFAERLAIELGIGREKLVGPNVIEGKVVKANGAAQD